MVSSCDKNLTNVHPSASQTTVPIALQAEGTVFAFCLLGNLV
jgi:hypothetical protein